MHELAVTESILEIALRHAPAGDGARITALNLVIGELATIVDESVQFYWDIITQNTPAEGAQLHFRRIPLEVQCQGCQTRYHPDGESFNCPSCGSRQVRILSGEEFFLESIDVEVNDA
jgi:hydrogenase nickel incorporation protein HypA/HybF